MDTIVENKSCMRCQRQFSITDIDRAFYDKVSPVIAGKLYAIPNPKLCPDCRKQRRLVFRNERNLYKNQCDFSRKSIISSIADDKPYKVYSRDIWWSDKWDPLSYGQTFQGDVNIVDYFSRMFADFPYTNLHIDGENENSDYTNYAGYNKNCYLIFNAAFNEDCMYSRGITKCRNCLDIYFGQNNELCSESINCHECYNVHYSQSVTTCSDSYFLFDCVGCRDCIGCSNLRQKQYYIFNQAYSKDEYFRKKEALELYKYSSYLECKKQFEALCLQSIHKLDKNTNVDQCTGDCISHAKNCIECFEIDESEDCKWCDAIKMSQNCYDLLGHGYHSSFIYEGVSVGVSNMMAFCWLCTRSNSCYYCVNCHNSKECFGCFGLKNAEYCIFNKRYSSEDYYKLLPQVISKMMNEGLWGEFFPASFSPYAYNETLAQEYFPSTSSQVAMCGWKWREDTEDARTENYKHVIIPDSTHDVSDDICQEILIGEQTRKPYKILAQELAFYRDQGLSIPRNTPDYRHSQRVRLRNPWKVWKRQCNKCQKNLHTTYAPERPEKVYCEECYSQAIY